jgi:AFG3 family protein
MRKMGGGAGGGGGPGGIFNIGKSKATFLIKEQG